MWVMVACTFGMLAGCGPAPVKLPPKAAVKGSVKLNGAPLANGEIVFTIPGQPEQRLTVTGGSYTGEATIGMNSVGVFSYIESAPTSGLATDTVQKTNIVAQRFSYQTQLTADVKADTENEFSFDVSTQ